MRGTPITGAARSVSITDTVARGSHFLKDRPEPRGRDRAALRQERRNNRADTARPAEA